jgi:hypothetical protein
VRAQVDGAQHLGQLQRIGLVFGVRVARHFLHPVQVGAGAEGGAIGRQHDGAQIASSPSSRKARVISAMVSSLKALRTSGDPA